MGAMLGTICLILLVPVAVYSAGMMLVGVYYRVSPALASGRAAAQAACTLVLLASGLLVSAFLQNDFSLKYVAEHSSLAMALPYKLAGLWAGLDGSLLFWALLLSIMTWSVTRQLARCAPELLPITNAVLMTILGFFGIVLLYAANPFTTTLEIPFDGAGLNPLLQAPEMVIHPPSLYLGYVSAAIPFALMAAMLLTGKRSPAADQLSRRWLLFCWLFLSVGNLLGMHWAYLELGWGGFWAWDPVENAAIMPWFTATALLHSLIAQRTRRLFPVWNVALLSLTFVLTMLGTYLTRSGVVQSVHAFSNSTVGVYFAIFLGMATIAGCWLTVRQARQASRQPIATLLSKEGGFLLGNILLTAGALSILWGTMLPTLSEGVFGHRVTVGPEFFNRMMAPFGIVVLFLLGVGPGMAWGRMTGKAFWELIRRPLTLAMVLIAAAWWLGIMHWFVLCCGAAVVLSGLLTLRELFHMGQKIRVAPVLRSPITVWRRVGGYVVHAGFILLMAGIAGSALQGERDLEMREGDRMAVGGVQLQFAGLRYRQTPQFEAIGAELHVQRAGADVATIYPARQFYPGSEQPTTEIGLYSTWWYDVYAVLGAFDVDAGTVQLKVLHNPLMNWLWCGGILLVIGMLILMTERRSVAT